MRISIIDRIYWWVNYTTIKTVINLLIPEYHKCLKKLTKSVTKSGRSIWKNGRIPSLCVLVNECIMSEILLNMYSSVSCWNQRKIVLLTFALPLLYFLVFIKMGQISTQNFLQCPNCKFYLIFKILLDL